MTTSTYRIVAPPTGNIHVEDHGTHLVLLLAGDVGAALRDEASVALARASVADVPVAFDATHLHTIDPTGVAFLWQTAEVVAEQGRRATLLNPPAHLVDELDTLRVSDLFTVVTD